MVSDRDFKVAPCFSLINTAALNIRSLKINFPIVHSLLFLNFRDKKDSLTEKTLASFVTDNKPNSLSGHFNTNSAARFDKLTVFVIEGICIYRA